MHDPLVDEQKRIYRMIILQRGNFKSAASGRHVAVRIPHHSRTFLPMVCTVVVTGAKQTDGP